MHPNRRFNLRLSDSQIAVLSNFEVVQIETEGPVYLYLLKKGSASVVVAKSRNVNDLILNWANKEGYALLGIPESDPPPPKD